MPSWRPFASCRHPGDFGRPRAEEPATCRLLPTADCLPRAARRLPPATYCLPLRSAIAFAMLSPCNRPFSMNTVPVRVPAMHPPATNRFGTEVS